MIIVTGASRGLGLCIANRLQSSGFDIFGLSRDTSSLEFESMDCDVSNYKDVKKVAAFLRKGGYDVEAVINVAGVASMNLAVTTPESTTQKLLGINLAGTIYSCQLFAPLMMRKKKGQIINFSTIAVPLGLKGESVYVASKAGVEGFSRVFAREMADFNIGVNCIAPGPIDTALLSGITESQIDKIVSRQIIPKQFLPNDIADIVELLLNDKAGALTGHVFNVGGV